LIQFQSQLAYLDDLLTKTVATTQLWNSFGNFNLAYLPFWTLATVLYKQEISNKLL